MNVAQFGLVVGIILLVALAVVWFGHPIIFRGLQDLARLRKGRGDPGRGIFFAYLTESGLSAEQSQRVYQYLQQWVSCGCEDFPVELDDEIGGVLGICGLDVPNVAKHIAAVCRCEIPPSADLREDQTVREFLNVVLQGRSGKPWWLGEFEGRGEP